ncbi:MAG: DUF3300 domain-containing protein [Edaphobacter sp.]
MTSVTKPLCLVLLTGFITTAFAQAPIVRQPPPPPPPDQQQADPQYQPPAPPPPPDAQAQPQSQPPELPPTVPPQQLDQLVQRIALYPDPLLAQVLTASTFWQQIPDAATWAQQHSSLTGDALAQAIQADNLPWDPSVLALLPFPSVLDMMARDPQWTGTLGNAVLVQRNDVMDAVQRQRQAAHNYGYLTSTPYDNVVDNGGAIEIQPVNTAYYYVPVYNPAVVFYAPRPGFVIATGIRFGPAIVIAPAFGVYGWFGAGFGWRGHTILIDHRPWTRTYYNRSVYVHPYEHPYVRPAAPRAEYHAQPAHHEAPPHEEHKH